MGCIATVVGDSNDLRWRVVGLQKSGVSFVEGVLKKELFSENNRRVALCRTCSTLMHTLSHPSTFVQAMGKSALCRTQHDKMEAFSTLEVQPHRWKIIDRNTWLGPVKQCELYCRTSASCRLVSCSVPLLGRTWDRLVSKCVLSSIPVVVINDSVRATFYLSGNSCLKHLVAEISASRRAVGGYKRVPRPKSSEDTNIINPYVDEYGNMWARYCQSWQKIQVRYCSQFDLAMLHVCWCQNFILQATAKGRVIFLRVEEMRRDCSRSEQWFKWYSLSLILFLWNVYRLLDNLSNMIFGKPYTNKGSSSCQRQSSKWFQDQQQVIL